MSAASWFGSSSVPPQLATIASAIQHRADDALVVSNRVSTAEQESNSRAARMQNRTALDLRRFPAVQAGRAGECVRPGARRAWSRPVADMVGSTGHERRRESASPSEVRNQTDVVEREVGGAATRLIAREVELPLHADELGRSAGAPFVCEAERRRSSGASRP
jgi:hypothetical protein